MAITINPCDPTFTGTAKQYDPSMTQAYTETVTGSLGAGNFSMHFVRNDGVKWALANARPGRLRLISRPRGRSRYGGAMSRDRDDRSAPPLSTQTSRALPTHTSRSGSKNVGAAPSKIANVEGPIVPGTFVTQRFQRGAEGMVELKVAADLILQLDAVVESKGYTAKIKVNAFDAIWSRYDAGDYGSGDAGRAVYDDIDGVPPVWVVAGEGSRQIQLAS